MKFGPTFLDDTTPTTSNFPNISRWWKRVFTLFSGHPAENPVNDEQHPLYAPFNVTPEEVIQHILNFLPHDKELYLKLRLVGKRFRETIDKETFRHVFFSLHLKEEAKRYELLWLQQGDINHLLLKHRAKLETGSASASVKKAFHLLEKVPENMSYFSLYLRTKAIERMHQTITQETHSSKEEEGYPFIESEREQPQGDPLFDLDLFELDYNDSKMIL